MSLKRLRRRDLREPDPKDKRTLNLAPSDRPADPVASDVMQTNESNMHHTEKGSVTFVDTHTKKKIKPDARAKTNILTPPPVVSSVCMEHQAADALSPLKTT